MKNSVPSEATTTSGGERENHGNVSKTVLSGPEEEGTYNRFSCFAVHSKMSQGTNANRSLGKVRDDFGQSSGKFRLTWGKVQASSGRLWAKFGQSSG